MVLSLLRLRLFEYELLHFDFEIDINAKNKFNDFGDGVNLLPH